MINLRIVKNNLTIENHYNLGQLEFWRRFHQRLVIRYIDPERPRRFPTKIQIEATSKCNLRCPTCPHSTEKGLGRHLTGEELRGILDRLPRFPATVILSGIGEPLINPHFFELVDILAERGISCTFYTNGTLLTKPVRAAILSKRNIAAIRISCDGAQKTSFENLRLGANFESWKQSVHQFLVEAKEKRGKTLSIGLRTVLSKQNLAEIEEIIRLAAELGFESIGILDPIPMNGSGTSMCLSQKEFSTIHEKDLCELAQNLGIKAFCLFRRSPTAPPPFFNLRCIQPWEYIFVRADGDIAPCCALFSSEKGAVMGNIFKQGFRDIWVGDLFREFRKTSASGTNSLCCNCPYY